jgi:hypothetical protein
MKNYVMKLVLLSLCLAIFSGNIFGAELITVYFVPFQIETYVPITQATIVSKAWEKWTLKSNSQISALKNILNQGDESKFESHRVRALIISDTQTIYVDANGTASINGDVGKKIDKNMFVKFRDSLDSDERLSLRGGESMQVPVDK